MKSVLQHCDPARLIQLPAGTVLLAEGVMSGRLFVLAEGSVEVLRGDIQVTLIDEPGAIFGEMSALLDAPHTATVRSLSPVSVYAFDEALDFLRSDPELVFLVSRMLAERLNAVTIYLADIKRQYDGHGNHLGMVSEVLASLLHHQEAEFIPGSDREVDPRQ